MEIERLKQAFRNIFQAEPILVKSPGRINIIGEHIDYNEGFVMPAAIDKAIYVAVSNRADDSIHLYSQNYSEIHVSSLLSIEKSEKGWANYVLGVVDQLIKNGHKLSGFNLYLDGNVPLGSGLSSSAALECATAFALDHLNGLGISKMDLALISQKAEHVFAGVNCGIMDQFASVFGKKDYAVLLDCRSMEYEYIPLNLEGYKLVLLNTNVKHSLSDSAYNNRRLQCEQGVMWVKEHQPEVNSLRDIGLEMLEKYVKPKSPDVYSKCKFVVTEIGRIQNAAHQLKNGDLAALGALMLETHDGLSREYEVSCKELDFLVNFVKDLPYVLGARMMGGGFGGCTINIVKNENVNTLIETISTVYLSEFNLILDAYIVETANGSELVA